MTCIRPYIFFGECLLHAQNWLVKHTKQKNQLVSCGSCVSSCLCSNKQEAQRHNFRSWHLLCLFFHAYIKQREENNLKKRTLHFSSFYTWVYFSAKRNLCTISINYYSSLYMFTNSLTLQYIFYIAQRETAFLLM